MNGIGLLSLGACFVSGFSDLCGGQKQIHVVNWKPSAAKKQIRTPGHLEAKHRYTLDTSEKHVAAAMTYQTWLTRFARRQSCRFRPNCALQWYVRV